MKWSLWLQIASPRSLHHCLSTSSFNYINKILLSNTRTCKLGQTVLSFAFVTPKPLCPYTSSRYFLLELTNIVCAKCLHILKIQLTIFFCCYSFCCSWNLYKSNIIFFVCFLRALEFFSAIFFYFNVNAFVCGCGCCWLSVCVWWQIFLPPFLDCRCVLSTSLWWLCSSVILSYWRNHIKK